MVFGDGAFEMQLSHEGRNLMNGISNFKQLTGFVNHLKIDI